MYNDANNNESAMATGHTRCAPAAPGEEDTSIFNAANRTKTPGVEEPSHQGPLLLTLFNFKTSMDKLLHPL